MKKEIQDHVIVKNRYYSFLTKNDKKVEGTVVEMSYINDIAEDDFDLLIDFEDGTQEKFHSTDIIDIVEMSVDICSSSVL